MIYAILGCMKTDFTTLFTRLTNAINGHAQNVADQTSVLKTIAQRLHILSKPDSREVAAAGLQPEAELTSEAKALEKRSEAFRAALSQVRIGEDREVLRDVIHLDSLYINDLQNTVFSEYVSPFFSRLAEINKREAKNVTRGDLEHMQRMLALYANPVHAQEFKNAVSGNERVQLNIDFLSALVQNGFARSVADQLGELS